MKNAFALLFIITSLLGKSQDRKVIYEYKTNSYSIHKEYQVLVRDTTILDGYYKQYREGKLRIEGNNSNNKRIGEWTKYFTDGRVCSKMMYINGAKNGVYVRYGYNDKVYIVGNFKNDEQEGKWHYYTPEGYLYAILNYRDGKLHDTSASYLPNSKLYCWKLYDNGKLQYQQLYDTTGNLYQTDSLLDNLIYIQKLYNNGTLYGKVWHKDSIYISSEFYNSDTILYSGNFENGTGKVLLYYPNGNVEFELNYKDNELAIYSFKNNISGKIDTIVNTKYLELKEKKHNYILEKNLSLILYRNIKQESSYMNDTTNISLMKFLQRNIIYPDYAKENGIQGKVGIEFVVDMLGDIIDTEIVKDPGGELGKEALRVVDRMDYWYPGTMNGMPVKFKFKLPVIFKLQ